MFEGCNFSQHKRSHLNKTLYVEFVFWGGEWWSVKKNLEFCYSRCGLFCDNISFFSVHKRRSLIRRTGFILSKRHTKSTQFATLFSQCLKEIEWPLNARKGLRFRRKKSQKTQKRNLPLTCLAKELLNRAGPLISYCFASIFVVIVNGFGRASKT
jgi:hypothetical protein